MDTSQADHISTSRFCSVALVTVLNGKLLQSPIKYTGSSNDNESWRNIITTSPFSAKI